MTFDELMQGNTDYNAMSEEEKVAWEKSPTAPYNVGYQPGRVAFSYNEYYRLLINRGHHPDDAKSRVEHLRNARQRVWVDKKGFYDIVKDTVTNLPGDFFNVAGEAARMDRNVAGLLGLIKEFGWESMHGRETPLMDSLFRHYSGIVDMMSEEGRQIAIEFITNHPSQFAADVAMFAVPASKVTAPGRALSATLNRTNFGRYAKAAGKTLLDPANVIEIAEIPGTTPLAEASSFEARRAAALDTGQYSPEGGRFRWQDQGDVSQTRAAAMAQVSPYRRTERAYKSHMGEVDADLQRVKSGLFDDSHGAQMADAVVGHYIDNLTKGEVGGALDTDFGALTPEQLDKNIKIFEKEIGRSLTDVEVDGLLNPLADTTALRRQLAGEWLAHNGDWYDMTTTQTGVAISDTAQKTLNEWNTKISGEYERALEPIKDNPAEFTRAIEVIEEILEEETRTTGRVTTDLNKLRSILTGMFEDNAAGITVAQMDKLRTRFRMNMLDSGIQLESRMPVDKYANQRIYDAISEDLFEAAKPQGAVFSELELIKRKDAIFIQQGERGFRKIIQRYSDPKSPEYSPEKLAQALLSKPVYFTGNVIADVERHLGGVDSLGWRAMQSYYLDELLETKARGKGDTTAMEGVREGESMFTHGGLARAIQKNKDTIDHVLGPENADFLRTIATELQEFEMFQSSIGGSPTMRNQVALLGQWLASPRSAVSGAAGVVSSRIVWEGIQRLGETVLVMPDLAVDIAAGGLSFAAGMLSLFGSDFYKAYRELPSGGSLPPLNGVQKVIRNVRKAGFAQATRIAIHAREESWKPED